MLKTFMPPLLTSVRRKHIHFPPRYRRIRSLLMLQESMRSEDHSQYGFDASAT